MIRRSMALLESEHKKYAESLTGERNGKIKANIIGTLRHLEGQRPVLTAVIAAIANDPKLVEPMRESIRKEFQELSKELTLRTDDIAILFLASQGLLLMELLNLSFLTPSQIRKVTQRMLQLVEDLDPGRESDGVSGSGSKDRPPARKACNFRSHRGLNSLLLTPDS